MKRCFTEGDGKWSGLAADKGRCSGCTARANICPRGCIEMKADFEGFLYPVVHSEQCSECNLCRLVCPVAYPADVESGERESFVIRAKNPDTIKKSTSGGFFTPLADFILELEGVVCAAAFDRDFKVIHRFLEASERDADPSIYDSFRGSKYVQSSLGGCYQEIKTLLLQERMVCFVGTPCQVNGLKKYLGREYGNLVTVDLVCHGTPSPRLWEKYLEYQSEKAGAQIQELSFRNKTYGYHSSTMRILFQNGRTYCGSARVDYMLKSFFQEIASRPICYQCPFKQLERCSDFTIYDCWHVSKLVPGIKDDDKGYTNLMIQSQKGRKIFDRLKERLVYFPVDTEKAVRLDGIMVRNSAAAHPQRGEYYKELDQETLPEHIQRFISIRKRDYAVEYIKRMLYRTGILRPIKHVVRKLSRRCR